MKYFREIARNALSERYDVQFAGCLNDAMEILAAGGVDLLVLDLVLENGEAGIDLLRRLVVKPCPILIYTSRDESEMYGDVWDELQAEGADDLLVKGMNVEDALSHKVARLIGDDADDESLID